MLALCMENKSMVKESSKLLETRHRAHHQPTNVYNWLVFGDSKDLQSALSLFDFENHIFSIFIFNHAFSRKTIIFAYK